MIKNRFLASGIITVHDELLSSLYELKPDTIYCKRINGERYLINSIKGKNFEIGLRVKITNDKSFDNTPDDVYLLNDYSNPNYFSDSISLQFYYKDLCFSNMEKYMTNILFDKYLSQHQDFDMTFLEIEQHYRGKVSKRSTFIGPDVAKRYAKTLDKLCKKELFLITSDKFREKKYGVRSLRIHQPFLSINSCYKNTKNSISFSYSFGGFGRVIKLSRRYSTILHSNAYQISFNQLKYYLTGFYLAKEVFIKLGALNKNSKSRNNFSYTVDIEKISKQIRELEFMEQRLKNPLRNRITVSSYIDRMLSKIEGIIRVESKFSYDETDEFIKKHEFDYDIETDLDNYEFSLNDLDKDVYVKYTVILKENSDDVPFN